MRVLDGDICEWGKSAGTSDTRLTQRSLHFDTSLIRVSNHMKFDTFDTFDSSITTYQTISKIYQHIKNRSKIYKEKTSTLNKIIEESPFKNHKINLISIDIEDHEFEALKNFDFNTLDGETIGTCLAYRYWYKINWFPDHYCCVDDVVIKSNIEDIKKLIVENRCKTYLLTKSIINTLCGLFNFT